METQEQKDERMALELFPDIPKKKNYRPEACHGVIALVIEVPPAERSNPANDIAEAYAVETGNDIPGGCIIWGSIAASGSRMFQAGG